MDTRIVLGSGKVYLKELSGTVDTSNADTLITTYATSENEFAAVKNGATLTYTPTYYTAKDDLGRYEKTIMTEEVATLGLGLITSGSDTLTKLVDTATTTTATSGGTKTVKIGGSSNAKNKSYVIVFEHKDAKDGDIYVIIVGKNTAELQFQFQPGTETILNPTFTAEPMDSNGTKILIAFKSAPTDGGNA